MGGGSRKPARFGKLVDLGDIPLDPEDDPSGPLGSRAGHFDIIISGFGGLDIYSFQEETGEWRQIRSVPVLGPTGVTYLGVALYRPSNNLDESVLVVVNRSLWDFVGQDLDAPCFFYDYRTNQHFHYFSQRGQTVSVAVIDDNERMVVGAGGNDQMIGQPNYIFEFGEEEGAPTCTRVEAGQQLTPTVPPTYGLMELDENNEPTPAEEFVSVALSGRTKTRQVFPFRIPGYASDYILEVNEAQPAYIYCRNERGETFRIISLPGTEGERDAVWARAADVVVEQDALYVVFAMNFEDNLAYTVDMSLLLDESVATSAPTPSPTTSNSPVLKRRRL